jgi:amino acid adenylation domain-containing protein
MTDIDHNRTEPLDDVAPPAFFSRLAGQVERRPDAQALVDGTVTLTYERLGVAVAEAADALQRDGVRAGDRVGVASRRSLATVVEVLAVLAIGGTYLPFDRAAPADRLRFQATDAGVSLILVDEDEGAAWAAVFGPLRRRTVRPLERVRGAAGDRRASALLRSAATIDRHELAYIVFTSGSTGRPKGVAVTRANLDALLEAWDEVMGPVRHISLLGSALSFDASVAELFWPLAAGGRLVIAPEARRTANRPGPGAGFTLALGPLLRDRRVTHLQCTPTRAALMLADADDRAALARLDHLVVGGEALTVALARDLLGAGVRRLTNAYGPTECTVWATTHDVTEDDLVGGDEQPVPVGVGLRHATIDVVGPGNRSAPTMGRGELVIGGALVSDGYLRRPELTAERFVSHRVGAAPATTVYRTGDVAWRRADGLFVVSGRNDQQVKIRGHRIELGEIEALLVAEPDVQLAIAAVVTRHDRPTIVAAVVAREGTSLDDARCEVLRAVVATQLSEVAAPELVVRVSSLATLSSGKVDRSAVQTLLADATARHDAQVVAEFAPGDASLERRRNDELRDMVSDFATVLGRGGVTPESDFFLLGGHSLAAVELVARIAARTGQRLSIRSLLSAGTPRALVAWRAKGPERTDRVIVKLTGDGSQVPTRTLFLIHGAGGNVLRFRSLAQAIRDLVNVVGVQAVAAEGGDADRSLRAMVLRYTDAITETDPSGTYELGGYSSGGTIAMEVAAELVQRGCGVRSLVLIDPIDDATLADGIVGRIRAVRSNLTAMADLDGRERRSAAWEGWRRRREWDEAGSKALKDLGYADLFDHIARVTAGAPVRQVDAPALLIRSSVENPFRVRTYVRALSAPRTVSTVWVRAKHDELLQPPSIPAIAHAVESFLSEV